MISPYDARTNSRRAQLDGVRRNAAKRFKTVADLEARQTERAQTVNAQKPMIQSGKPMDSSGSDREKVETLRSSSQFAQNESLWRKALADRATPQRLATRGEMVVKGNKRFYRRKSDGKAIPIDANGNVIRR